MLHAMLQLMLQSEIVELFLSKTEEVRNYKRSRQV